MYRTHTCEQLRLTDINTTVTLAGWVQRSRNLGSMIFIDLRDRYGITQLFFNTENNAGLYDEARQLGREFVIQATGKVVERSSKNLKIPTGEIEIEVEKLVVLNKSEIPPFTIEDETDGGEEQRMKFRYLDLRRRPIQRNIELRHQLALATRTYLDTQKFIEVETPVLIKSTPEGARDFIVPSRLQPGTFYALPQSPQLFKQLLMVSGFDRYYQIVKCFRDEDFRADRQPEFTQIDCEMSFVEQNDVLELFEGLICHLFKVTKGVDLEQPFKRMTYQEAMEMYGSDKPDLRFGMPICDLTDKAKGKGFKVFDDAAYVGAICATGCSEYSRKQIDELTEFVKRPQVGAKGLVYVKCSADGTFKSSVDKFYTVDDFTQWMQALNGKPGDLLLLLTGERSHTLNALCELRLEIGNILKLRTPGVFAPLWVIDFPMLEWNEEAQRFFAMHHPFTSPKPEDAAFLESDPGKVRANAYDMVINGAEVGGGSIRIHDRQMQQTIFNILGFTPEEAENQFGFLLNAFRYGAPPHGGVAFGLDRLAAIIAGADSIREVIAFPKNNAGRDLMIDSPSAVNPAQLVELGLVVVKK